MHAVPRWNGKSRRFVAAANLGHRAPGTVVANHGRCFHLRSGSGGAESDSLRDQAFRRRADMKIDVKELGDCVPFLLNGRSVVAVAEETILQAAKRNGV